MSVKTLTPSLRRAFRAKAHHLNPFVSIGQHGLTVAVLHEIDLALTAHELVKIRVFSDDRLQREGFLARICDELDAAPVQHLGKLIILWRPRPEPVVANPVPARRAKGSTNSMARPAERSRAGARKPPPATTPENSRRYTPGARRRRG
jgi:putative YhbY family RNA-binding protein